MYTADRHKTRTRSAGYNTVMSSLMQCTHGHNTVLHRTDVPLYTSHPRPPGRPVRFYLSSVNRPLDCIHISPSAGLFLCDAANDTKQSVYCGVL